LCKQSKNLEGKIGVISPYKSQVLLLKNLLKTSGLSSFAEHVNTVDAFQGQEKEIIIMNCVRSNKYGQIGFLQDERRLNVAITRAKYYLFIIGSEKTLNTNKVWYNLIESVKKNGNYDKVY
jgi:superfamily I DNA and/or RNA helicase